MKSFRESEHICARDQTGPTKDASPCREQTPRAMPARLEPPLTGALTPNFNCTEWSMYLNQHWQRLDSHPALPPQEESGGPTEKGGAPVTPGWRETVDRGWLLLSHKLGELCFTWKRMGTAG